MSTDKVTIISCNITTNCSQIENQSIELNLEQEIFFLPELLVKQDCSTVPLPSGRSHSQFSKHELCSYNGLQPGKRREGQEKEKSLYLEAIQLRLFLDPICMCCVICDATMPKMQLREQSDLTEYILCKPQIPDENLCHCFYHRHWNPHAKIGSVINACLPQDRADSQSKKTKNTSL